jgi:RimJ/RimL family protein N-acetyltransferase
MAPVLPVLAPELTGDGVRLGPWREDDVDAVLELADPEVRTWLRSLRDVGDAEAARAWLARRSEPGRVDWAVRDPASGALVGRVALHDFSEAPPSAVIGFGVHPAYRGRGLAATAVEAALMYALATLRLTRVALVHAAGNVASCAVARRCGFAFEGTERAALDHGDGVAHDAHRHARLATDAPGPTAAAPVPHVVPEVVGDGVLLGPWRDADLPRVLELADDAQTRAWSPSLRPVRDLAAARAWVAGRHGPDRVDWAVRDPAGGELIGRVGLHRFTEHPGAAEVGYGVHPAYRGRGVARRAVAAAAGYGFGVLGLARLSLVHAVGNPASCAVATRVGFAYEGTERAALDHGDGVLHDVHRHARLATDPDGPADAAPVPLAVPVLETGDLVLRPWRADDAGVYLRGLTDPESAKYYPLPPPRTEDDARRLIGRLHRRAVEGSAVAWAVEADGAVAGSIAVRSINLVDRHASTSYWVLPEARGRGVAPRALGIATSYAFDVLDLHRMQLQHAVTNPASCRVADKAGFVLESVQRESCLLADGFVDEHQHVRLRR